MMSDLINEFEQCSIFTMLVYMTFFFIYITDTHICWTFTFNHIYTHTSTIPYFSLE